MVYLLEDDDSIRKLVVYALRSQGFDAEGYEKPSLFWKAVNSRLPSLVLLDIMLPEEDGISVLRKLKESSLTKKIPVIMLTAKSSEYEKVEGLDAGADDYIVKPFGIMELTARVRAVLRRTESESSSCDYHIGSLHIFPSKHEVTADGVPVILTLKEYELLCLLAENEGKALNRAYILDHIWDLGDEPENRTLDVHIRTLRSKLGKCGKYIETLRGIGYKLNGGQK